MAGITRLAHAENPHLEIICEVADQSRITYLSTNSASGQELAAPQFAAGRVYSPAMLDIILSQAYYNNHVRHPCRQYSDWPLVNSLSFH